MSRFEAIEIDDAWDERHEARLLGSEEWRQYVVDRDEFWAPLPGSAETAIEIAWDKARLDAEEVCTRMELEYPKEVIDTYQIARLTAGELEDDTTNYIVGGCWTMAGMIVVENNGMLMKMLYPDIVGLVPSSPNPELTIQFVQGLEMQPIAIRYGAIK